MKNGNSSINQEIKGKFVGQHVLACVTTFMDNAMEAASSIDSRSSIDLPVMEDVENRTYYEINGEQMTYEEKEEYVNTFDEKIEQLEIEQLECETEGKRYQKLEHSIEKLELDKSEADETEESYNDVLEWYIITGFLYRKLQANGIPVLEYGNCYYWGRCTSGQSYILDGSITDVCEEMGILAGQGNSWEESVKPVVKEDQFKKWFLRNYVTDEQKENYTTEKMETFLKHAQSLAEQEMTNLIDSM